MATYYLKTPLSAADPVTKAADRAAMVDEMIAAVRKAWDERHQ